MHFSGSFECILDEYIIEGIVVADDRTDNFYKSIILQDSTGGITIRMDASGLYNDYPIGRKICVRLKNLWLGDYAKMIQLGAAVDRSDPLYPELVPIPVPLFSRHIIKKELNQPVVPRVIRFDQLDDSFQSCLVQLSDVEFSVSDTGKTFADAVNKLSGNATIKSCAGGTAYVRTSGFANFASAKIPRGNGNITAVYSVFRTEKQLLLRDTSDVKLTGLRCTAAGFKKILSENFDSQQPGTELTITGWKNIAESGSVPFSIKGSAGNLYAEISCFATGKSSVISWLILPPINLNNSANELLRFQTRDGFDNGATLQVYVSTNYDGGSNPSKARWTALRTVIAKGSASGMRSEWIVSGNTSLNSFAGPVYLAFRYDGADPVNALDKRTTTFQLDNIQVEGN